MNKLFLPQTLRSTVQQTIRTYAFKSDLKIKWVRPEKILCTKPVKSGDQSSYPAIDPKQYVLEFQQSKELESYVKPFLTTNLC